MYYVIESILVHFSLNVKFKNRPEMAIVLWNRIRCYNTSIIKSLVVIYFVVLQSYCNFNGGFLIL